MSAWQKSKAVYSNGRTESCEVNLFTKRAMSDLQSSDVFSFMGTGWG